MNSKPYFTVSVLSVVYSDGYAKAVGTFTDDEVPEGEIHATLDDAARAQHAAMTKGSQWSGPMARGNNYPVAVVTSFVEADLTGGEATNTNVRTFDVSGYLMMEELALFLELLDEAE